MPRHYPQIVRPNTAAFREDYVEPRMPKNTRMLPQPELQPTNRTHRGQSQPGNVRTRTGGEVIPPVQSDGGGQFLGMVGKAKTGAEIGAEQQKSAVTSAFEQMKRNQQIRNRGGQAGGGETTYQGITYPSSVVGDIRAEAGSNVPTGVLGITSLSGPRTRQESRRGTREQPVDVSPHSSARRGGGTELLSPAEQQRQAIVKEASSRFESWNNEQRAMRQADAAAALETERRDQQKGSPFSGFHGGEVPSEEFLPTSGGEIRGDFDPRTQDVAPKTTALEDWSRELNAREGTDAHKFTRGLMSLVDQPRFQEQVKEAQQNGAENGRIEANEVIQNIANMRDDVEGQPEEEDDIDRENIGRVLNGEQPKRRSLFSYDETGRVRFTDALEHEKRVERDREKHFESGFRRPQETKSEFRARLNQARSESQAIRAADLEEGRELTRLSEAEKDRQSAERIASQQGIGAAGRTGEAVVRAQEIKSKTDAQINTDQLALQERLGTLKITSAENMNKLNAFVQNRKIDGDLLAKRLEFASDEKSKEALSKSMAFYIKQKSSITDQKQLDQMDETFNLWLASNPDTIGSAVSNYQQWLKDWEKTKK